MTMTYPGLYRATVLSNADPHRRGRLLVKLSTLGLTEPAWAQACLTPGSRSLPINGDEVLVSFEQGELSHPFWIGATWGSTSVEARSVEAPLTMRLRSKGEAASKSPMANYRS